MWVKTWIIRIMMNRCYRRKEKPGFKNEIMQQIKDDSPRTHSGKPQGPNQWVQNRELKQIIESSLSRLPKEYRLVFSLREIMGLRISETAALLDISPANVKVRLHRAKSMLKNEMIRHYSPRDLFEFHLEYCDRIVVQVMKKIKSLRNESS